jgi:hypothetical protein
MSGNTLASELSIMPYMEISNGKIITEIIDLIMDTVREPKRALPKDVVKQALEMDN